MVVLSALEIDTQLPNVNVLTGSDSVWWYSGGHCDTAIASALSHHRRAAGTRSYSDSGG
ncbi:citrate lyase subunit alpha [Escherichia coli]